MALLGPVLLGFFELFSNKQVCDDSDDETQQKDDIIIFHHPINHSAQTADAHGSDTQFLFKMRHAHVKIKPAHHKHYLC